MRQTPYQGPIRPPVRLTVGAFRKLTEGRDDDDEIWVDVGIGRFPTAEFYHRDSAFQPVISVADRTAGMVVLEL